MKFPTYVIASLAGTLPLLIPYVYVGSLSESLASAFFDDTSSNLWVKITLILLVVVTTVILIVVITWFTKKEINKAMLLLDSEVVPDTSQENIPILNEKDKIENESDSFVGEQQTVQLTIHENQIGQHQRSHLYYEEEDSLDL